MRIKRARNTSPAGNDLESVICRSSSCSSSLISSGFARNGIFLSVTPPSHLIFHCDMPLDSSLNRVVSESLFASLNEYERMVLNFLAVNGDINVSQCQRQLGLARWHTAKRLLMGM